MCHLSCRLVRAKRRQFTNHCRFSAANSETQMQARTAHCSMVTHPQRASEFRAFAFDRNFSGNGSDALTHTLKLHKTIVMTESVDVFFGFVSIVAPCRLFHHILDHGDGRQVATT